jgi:hypothetical protein
LGFGRTVKLLASLVFGEPEVGLFLFDGDMNVYTESLSRAPLYTCDDTRACSLDT